MLLGFMKFISCNAFSIRKKIEWFFIFLLTLINDRNRRKFSSILEKYYNLDSVQENTNRFTCSPKTVQIVNYENNFGKDGILTKIAKDIYVEISKRVQKCELTNLPSGAFDATLHIYYRFCIPYRNTRNFAYVTHVDSYAKLLQTIWLINNSVELICLSNETANLILNYALSNPRKVKVAPRVHVMAQTSKYQGPIRKFRIGFLSNLYSDGRKREDLLVEAFRNLNPDDFEIYFMGNGIERLVKEVRRLGFKVIYKTSFEFEFYTHILCNLDILVYPGKDEGAVSVLDALKVGIPVAITESGYHKDLDFTSGVEFFETSTELHRILTSSSERFVSIRRMSSSMEGKDIDSLLEILGIGSRHE